LKIKAVVETAIYVDDLQAAETFYGTILGLRVMGKEPGHHVFFQVGEASALLAFLAEATLKGDQLPGGYGHIEIGDQEMFGFVARALDYGRQAFENDQLDTLAEARASLERGLAE
jgi:catechol 2,3-dioxygenase-like lactoylglutathione lyase family enzyme